MSIFEKIIKIIACFLLMFFDLAAFGFGLACLAGGGEHSTTASSITMCVIFLAFSLLTGLCRRYGKNHNDLKYHQMFNSGTECPGIQIINAFSSIKNNVKENLN